MNTILETREWVTVDLDGDLLIGDSKHAREWVVDVNTHNYNYPNVELKVKVTLDATGNKTDEIVVGEKQLVRVCLKGYQITMFGYGTVKYAFA